MDPEVLPCAMMKNDGNSVLVYFPEVRSIQLNLDGLQFNDQCKAIWVDPRDGAMRETQITPDKTFRPPSDWEDAILVISSS